MASDRASGLSELLESGFGAVLAPAGFVPSNDRRTWVRSTGEIEHIIALLSRRSSFDVQWGLACPAVVEIMWGSPHVSFDIGQAIVSGTPSTIRHPAHAQSFDVAALKADSASIVEGVRADLEVVEGWMRRFTSRADVRNYLLENRERTDRRAFVIPAKLPLKLLTAAALAVADRDGTACELIKEAEVELAPFKGEISLGRLQRLREAAAGLGGAGASS